MTDEHGQSQGLRERIRAGDRVWLDPPGPVLVTVNEKHAFVLGLVAGIAVAFQPEWFAWGVAVAFLGPGAVKGYCAHERQKITMAMRTVLHEPWWALVPYVVCFGVVRWWVFGGVAW